MNTHTDTQLKQALAKMLPEKVYWDIDMRWTTDLEVLDTELLHLCWLVEEVLHLDDTYQYAAWLEQQSLPNKGKVIDDFPFHATWQQRVIALARVKGVEL